MYLLTKVKWWKWVALKTLGVQTTHAAMIIWTSITIVVPMKVISCTLCSHCDKRNLCIALSCCNLFRPVLFGNDYLRLIVLDNSFIYHSNLGNVFLSLGNAGRHKKTDRRNRFEKVQQKVSFSSSLLTVLSMLHIVARIAIIKGEACFYFFHWSLLSLNKTDHKTDLNFVQFLRNCSCGILPEYWTMFYQ